MKEIYDFLFLNWNIKKKTIYNIRGTDERIYIRENNQREIFFN